MAAMVCAFGAAVLFGYIGYQLFSKGWVGYEEKYIKGSQQTMESMFLTIPIQQLIYLSVLCFLVMTLIVGFLTGNFWVGAAVGTVAFAIPKILLILLKKRRDALFSIQLIDALISASNSLRAGLTLQQAFELIQNEMDKPVSQEFRLLNQQLRLGVSLEDAFQDMLKRMPGQDLELVVTATTIALDIGGNLPEVFSNIAETIRQRNVIEGKIKALTAQGKVQAIVICLLPLFIGIALNFVAPDMMKPILETPIGWCILGMIVVLELIGALVIKKIVTIDF
jgi:tight adherence protein B